MVDDLAAAQAVAPVGPDRVAAGAAGARACERDHVLVRHERRSEPSRAGKESRRGAEPELAADVEVAVPQTGDDAGAGAPGGRETRAEVADVNATRVPSGDHTGHASFEGRIRAGLAAVGTASTRTATSAPMLFTTQRYGGGVRET